MKAKVLDNTCIGCGACTVISDEFEFNDDGIAYAINEKVKEDQKEKVLEARDNCPVNAIVVEEEN